MCNRKEYDVRDRKSSFVSINLSGEIQREDF